MRFIYNAPAILHDKALIIGDTHFGMEDKLRQEGVYDEKFSERVLGRILSLLEETRAEKLIMLGDVKERITSLDPISANVIARLGLRAEVIIVRGNHDGGIEGCGARIVPSEGFVYGKLGLVHGHGWPSEECMGAEYLVSAHQHPQLSIVDRSGRRHSEPVWMIAEPEAENIAEHYRKFNRKIKLVLMPAFNPLVGASFTAAGEHLGPVLSNNLFKMDAANVYRLDGTLLGELKTIKG